VSDFVRKQTRNKPQARQSELCLTVQAKLLVIGWAWQLEQVQASHACHGWASGMLPVGARQAASDEVRKKMRNKRQIKVA
jgi:hypothetical protein